MFSHRMHLWWVSAKLATATTTTRLAYNVVTDFDAVGDGDADDTKHIQTALQALMDAGKGVDLHFPSGDYVCGPLTLSNVNDSKLVFDSGAHFWMRKDSSNWETNEKGKYVPWFSIDETDGLEIQGGTWNGDYDFWAQIVPKAGAHNPRPWMFNFKHMQHFTIKDATINDATNAHMRVSGSHIEVSGLHFWARLPSNNTDGILVCDADHVHVSNVHIQNSDDCLKVCDRAHNVTFEKSSCTGGHGLTIGGAGGLLDIDHVTWSDIDLLGMSYGARIKWTTETEGQIKNILYDQIRMTNVGRPISIESDYGSSSHRTEESLSVRSLTFSNIDEKWDSTQELGSSGGHFKKLGFYCDSKAQCKDLHLRHVNVTSAHEWVCENCGGDMDSYVSPDASEHFDPKSLRGNVTTSVV